MPSTAATGARGAGRSRLATTAAAQAKAARQRSSTGRVEVSPIIGAWLGLGALLRAAAA